jgi:hypothetical protein
MFSKFIYFHKCKERSLEFDTEELNNSGQDNSYQRKMMLYENEIILHQRFIKKINKWSKSGAYVLCS